VSPRSMGPERIMDNAVGSRESPQLKAPISWVYIAERSGLQFSLIS